MQLERNIKGLCDKYGLSYVEFLQEFAVDHPKELTVFELEALAEEYGVDVQALLWQPLFLEKNLKDKLQKIKLLVLDVDGVMTDGGMYFTEKGDQFKKYNAKDGMAILALTKNDFPVVIISSGFSAEMVKKRAEMLNIKECHVTREPKLQILQEILNKHQLKLENVAMIGDDINDLEVLRKIGLSICPQNAVNEIKTECNLILNSKGGEGCVREFIDNYLLDKPLTR